TRTRSWGLKPTPRNATGLASMSRSAGRVAARAEARVATARTAAAARSATRRTRTVCPRLQVRLLTIDIGSEIKRASSYYEEGRHDAAKADCVAPRACGIARSRGCRAGPRARSGGTTA